MKIAAYFRARRLAKSLASFTLVELLTVIAIIAILSALTLGAASAVMEKGRRSRAASEIQAMSTALEGYKTDNGIYAPAGSTTFTTNTYASSVNTISVYQGVSQVLFQALSGGQVNFTTPVSGAKSYMSFKANQIGDPTGALTGGSYIQDPWNVCYGYSTATNSSGATPYNGAGFFDLWSTAGVTYQQYSNNNNLTNKWITNWQ